MDRELICSALGLSPNPWPPDHYTLIGLRPVEANAATVEARVQELSARLRPYQLAQPDAVTDALNRLAQALVCLTDSAARAAYDASLHETEAPLAVMPLEPVIRPAPVIQPRFSPEVRNGSASHRLAYRRLVVARRLRAAWREAGALIGQPWWRLHDRAEAVEFVRHLWQIRDLASDAAAPPVAVTGQAGSLVVEMARRPRLLHDLRKLTPEERSALAADWRAGLTAIESEIRVLREMVRRPRLVPRSFARALRYFVTDGLDVTMFLLGLTALAIALYRSRN